MQPPPSGPAGHASPRAEAGRPCAGTVLGRVPPALTSGLVALSEGHAGLHGSCQLRVLLREGDQRPRASAAAVTCTDEARHVPGNRALYRHRLDSCYFSHFTDEEAGAEVQDLLKATRPGPNSDLPGAGGSLLPPALPNCPHCLHSWSSSCHFRLLTLPLLLFHVDTGIFSPPSPGWSGVLVNTQRPPPWSPAACPLPLAWSFPLELSHVERYVTRRRLEADSKLQSDIYLLLFYNTAHSSNNSSKHSLGKTP